MHSRTSLDSDPLHGAAPRGRSDSRLARVVYIGTAMIPAYGPLRAARFMHARGVPPCVLVAVLRLGDRRRNDAAMRRVTRPTDVALQGRRLPTGTRGRERETV
jgi:hypothetical protein